MSDHANPRLEAQRRSVHRFLLSAASLLQEPGVDIYDIESALADVGKANQLLKEMLTAIDEEAA